jgi:hypothetical protein
MSAIVMMHASRSASLACKDHHMGMILAARTRFSVAIGHGAIDRSFDTTAPIS